MQKTSFKDVKVLDLFEGGYKSMITVNKNTTVHETLKILYDTGILSVPVADQNIHIYPKHIAGFIDLLDILAYLIHVCEAYSLSYSNPSALATHFLGKHVGDLIDYSSRDKFKTVLEEDDLLSVMEVLGQGTHRVAVVNVLCDIQNLIAQSDVVQLIAANIALLGQYADAPIQNLGFLKQLVLVHASEPALTAFRRMNDMRVSAAPMVDDNGKYVGTLSVSDLKGLNADSFEFLKGTTQEFSEKHHYAMNVPLVCSPTDSFKKAISDLAQTQCRKHRVWIIDQDQRPVGVISHTDVCRIAHQLITSSTQSS